MRHPGRAAADATLRIERPIPALRFKSTPGLTLRHVLADHWRRYSPAIAWSKALGGPVALQQDAVVAWPAKRHGFGPEIRLRLPLPKKPGYRDIAVNGLAARGHMIEAAYCLQHGHRGVINLFTVRITKGALVLQSTRKLPLSGIAGRNTDDRQCVSAISMKGGWIAAVPLAQSRPPWSVRVWSLNPQTKDAIQIPVAQPQADIFSSEDGKTLGWVEAGHRVHLFRPNFHAKAPINARTISVVGSQLRHGAFSPSGKHVLLLASPAATPQGTLRANWAPTNGIGRQYSFRLKSTGCSFWDPVFSPGGNYAVCLVLHGNSELYILDLRRHRIQAFATARGNVIMAAVFSPHGHRIAVRTPGRVLILRLNLKTRYEMRTLSKYNPGDMQIRRVPVGGMWPPATPRKRAAPAPQPPPGFFVPPK